MQLRAAGLIILLVTVVCLGVLEFTPQRKRHITAIFASLSGIGTALVLVIAYLVSKQM